MILSNFLHKKHSHYERFPKLLDSILKKYIKLKAGNLTFNLSNNKLTQFTLAKLSIKASEDGEECEVIIYLRRMYLYHLTNTYLPTFTLLIIVEITLFFDESQLQVYLNLRILSSQREVSLWVYLAGLLDWKEILVLLFFISGLAPVNILTLLSL